MKGYKQSTPEEREKIKQMLDYGIPAKEVAKFATRSLNFVNLIARGDYEKNLIADRERKAKRREAEQAVLEEAVVEQAVEAVTEPADPFGQEALMNRIADGIDYNNALMNGVLMRLDALLKELGVKQ